MLGDMGVQDVSLVPRASPEQLLPLRQGPEKGLVPASAVPESQGRRCLFPWQPGPHVTPAKLDTPVPRETPEPSPGSPVTAWPHSSPESHRSDRDTHRNVATITELSTENVPEVELISLLGEQLPRYTLRADTVFGYDHGDWLRAPPGPLQPVAPLTPQQIEETLQYLREL
ncbi:PREDICTED: trafficking kinesin-binding protein 1-like [Ficedula albicollis]|uniref:trafficking kinesin-binding protein 1-like n=1 Tax=Ficedula albicollis TaxID=59894 RepID=UPI0007AD8770|nr:PREDICTED: trafficking kinesin-binding protein 1-like [Ficedula albicollis]